MRVHLIHGFNERHNYGDPAIARLKPFLSEVDFDVVVHDYGHINIAEVRLFNDNISRLIAPQIEDGDIIIAYSNGAAIVQYMLKYFEIKPSQLLLISPAIDEDWTPPDFIERMYVFYNKKDWIVALGNAHQKASRLWPWNWGLFNGKVDRRNRWGLMGRVGYKGISHRVVNINTLDTLGLPIGAGHGPILDTTIVKPWGRYIGRILRQ